MNSLFSNPVRVFRYCTLGALILSIVQFLIFYISAGFLYESAAVTLLFPFVIDFIEGFFPIASALIVFSTKAGGMKNKILPSLLISLPRMAYTFPYYYLFYVTDVFNSIEALILSFAVSILFVLLTSLQTFVCIYIINHVFSTSETKKSHFEKAKIFDFDNAFNFGILLSSIFVFVIFFIRELTATITFFVEVGSSYYIEEILTIVLSYILLPIFFFTHYSVCVLIKNKLIAPKE